MKKMILPLMLGALMLSCGPQSIQEEKSEEVIVRYDRPDAAILKGVFIPEGKSYFLTSGLVAPVKDENAVPGTYGRYGDTYEQSIGVLERIKETLGEAGYGLEDVVFLRVYLVPDREGVVHWEDWFKAYGEYFNNEQNSNKVARSTLAVHALANPDLLVEIEAVAAK